MANKNVFIYRVELEKNLKQGEKEAKIEYCYARNATVVREHYKEKYAKEKYDSIKAIPFAEGNIKEHPLPIEEFTEDLIKFIHERNLGTADKYSVRKQFQVKNVGILTDEDKESLGL